MNIAHINIGSNIGDSRSAIERAVAAVFELSTYQNSQSNQSHNCNHSNHSNHSNQSHQNPARWCFPRRSSIVESEPWGFCSDNRFLNIGVEILTDLSPISLLDQLQRIEQSISPFSHRNPDGSYRDRLIDLDLIFLLPYPLSNTLSNPLEMSLQLDHPRLQLPHPHASERNFVMIPIRQLWDSRIQ